MADYEFSKIEKKWQQYWEDQQTFKAEVNPSKPKYYALDMFPYPSGAGLHVGHPLGYIASDIVARYKRLKGFNVLHPAGFDSFGLPAEQYAIQTGQHPAITTEENITRYKEQLKNIGFSFDWSKEVRTSDPSFYKWTQWIFMQLFNSWYNKETDKAEPITALIAQFEHSGNRQGDGPRVFAVCDEDTPAFSNEDWKQMNEREQQEVLLKFRLTYLAEATVNWCPALGTVLANDEVKDGVSERGGYPVERKKMTQWMMRITAYAERLLQGLETVDWSEPLKEMQRNWIGKSLGAELDFKVTGNPVAHEDITLTVFTTRIDTIFGVTYLSIAPEHELIPQLTSPEQKAAVEEYISTAKNRSERDRMSDVKTVSGVFTGSYVINPLSGEKVQLWIADYVLAGYGTGVVMGVPSSDERDFRFANHFNLPIIYVIAGTETLENPCDVKYGQLINSGFLDGLDWKVAIQKAVERAEELGVGTAKINYRMRDAVFSRQRYWGEPVPVYFKDGIPYLIDESDLPLVLPEIDKYLPTETGEPPLGRAEGWKYKGKYPYELSTMPGWAGSSWYWYRYMDAQNDTTFASKEAIDYWKDVDLYIGGSEHATGHLLYSRFWNQFLYDLGSVPEKEPFKKLINQGMIQGRSNLVYRVNGTNQFVSYHLREQYETTALHVDVNIVDNDVLNLNAFKNWRTDFEDAEFILEDGKYLCGHEVEKMSKSKYNVVNPDDIIERFGADTLRLYEMFLGPLEQFKPWNTNGIDGSFKFLRKLWRLFHDEAGNLAVSDEAPTSEEWKVLHRTIHKVEEDIERHAFNTTVSTFMICVNELTTLKCHKRAILQEIVILLSPYAPHMAEELWQLLGNKDSITYATYPVFKPEYLVESIFEYPISVNGKVRAKITFSLDTTPAEIEKSVLASEHVQKWLEGKQPKKVIVVPKKIVNVVI
ncbi:MAG: leucine--tRNA ligase [Bacteroidota bacterium]